MKSINTYSLPIFKNNFSLAISDSRAHFGKDKYAIDFPLKEGTAVLASADGKVIDIKDDSKVGGDNPQYCNEANYVTIEHAKKEITQYIHLKHKGLFVKVGDLVERGQVIGLSGNTGYSTEPHLHFMVIKGRPGNWKTIEPVFDTKIEIKIFPIK